MPALAAFLGALFGKITEWIGTYLTKRAANYVALIVTLGAAVAVCWATIAALLSGLAMALPEPVVVAASWIMPSNVDACVSARIATEVALAGYRWHRQAVLNGGVTT